VLAGVLHLNGAPCHAGDLARAAAEAGAGAPDQCVTHIEGSLGLLLQIRWTTPGAARETQPVASRDGRWLVAYSGRVDNRDELVERYGLAAASTDGEILAAAIARDGIEAFGHAIGDFAIAAWNRAERRLFLARDAIGQRPLYYTETGGRLYFATALRAVREVSGVSDAPNEGYFAEFLGGAIVTLDETPFAGIRRVPPAHVLTAGLGAPRVTVAAYWTPPTATGPRRSDRDYIDECRARLMTATRACLRSCEPAGIELSGGLDSSAVVALARQITGAPPDTYSRVYPGRPFANGEVLDESPFIDAVVAATGAQSTRCHAPAVTREAIERTLRAHGQIPDLANGDVSSWPLMQTAAAAGRRVMLTGLGGDQWLTGTMARIPAMLRAGEWRQTWRFLREAHGPGALEFSWRESLRRIVASGTPPAMKAAYRRARPARPWPTWLSPGFASKTHLAERLRAVVDRVPAVRDGVLQESLVRLHAGGEVLGRESAYRTAADAGLEIRHPFFDRRFVEFAMTLPDDLRYRDGLTRFVLRRALGDDLPREVSTRRSKADLRVLRDPAITALSGGVDVTALRAAEMGWLEPRSFAESREAYLRSTEAPRPNDYEIFTVFAAEAWLAAHGSPTVA
jgi:asparagine synthase (glutamine-hydrolysing)